MNGLYILGPTLLTILISMMIVRAGAIALTMTGISYHKAKFQSLSAFSGTGFTTREAELVVNHPTRRLIISWMMILGNAGIVAMIITTTTSFIETDFEVLPLNLLVLAGGIVAIYLVATRTKLAGYWEAFIERRLAKTSLFEEGTVEELLHLTEGYGLVRVQLTSGSPLVGQTIAATGIPEKGFRILGIERDGDWIAAPRSMQELQQGDHIVVYGRLSELASIATAR